MNATEDHFRLMRDLLGSPPPGQRWVPCDGPICPTCGGACIDIVQSRPGRRIWCGACQGAGHVACVGALCPQCQGIGYELKEKGASK